MIDQLLHFLNARLDEDEHFSLESGSPDYIPADPLSSDEELQHVARWNVARACAEIAANRKLIAAYREALEWYDKNRHVPAGEMTGLRTAIKIAAEVYSDHPDYQPGWKVDLT